MAQVSSSAAQERPGAPPILFGTILPRFELLFFGGLFGAYFALRAQTSPWPPSVVELETSLAAVATALLVLSRRITPGSRPPVASTSLDCVWILITLALGAVFLGIQMYDYARLTEVSTNAYGTMYRDVRASTPSTCWPAGVMLVVLARTAQGAYRGRTDGMHAVGTTTGISSTCGSPFTTLFLVR